MNYIKELLKNKNAAFYVAFGFAALSLVTGIVYIASCGSVKGATVVPMLLMILAGVLFAGLAALNLTHIGAAAMGLSSLAAFCVMLVNVAPYVVEEIQNTSMTGFNIGAVAGLPAIIVSAILMLICAIAGNAFAYIGTEKK